MSEAELTQYKDKNHVDEILRQLELEREKSAQLSIQLQQQISRLLVLFLRVFILGICSEVYRWIGPVVYNVFSKCNERCVIIIIIRCTADPREATFLYQRISVAI